MKTVKLRFVKAHSIGCNSVMSDAYCAPCPFCDRNLCIWPHEYEKREISQDTSNVCEHFDGFTKGGAAIMRPKMSVVRYKNVIRLNGVILNRSLSEFLSDLENLDEQVGTYDRIRWPKWCPERRFKSIHKEAWRVYNLDTAKWKAQHAARIEDKERAELARLKAKYE